MPVIKATAVAIAAEIECILSASDTDEIGAVSKLSCPHSDAQRAIGQHAATPQLEQLLVDEIRHNFR